LAEALEVGVPFFESARSEDALLLMFSFSLPLPFELPLLVLFLVSLTFSSSLYSSWSYWIMYLTDLPAFALLLPYLGF
jgi:hypothetical protein